MAFLTLSMAEIFHAFNMRSLKGSIFNLKTQNFWLIGAGLLSFILTTAVIEINFLANAFSLANLNLREYGISLLLSIMIIPIVELVKLIMRKIKR
jgi:Ca2+-transporting ATPase